YEPTIVSSVTRVPDTRIDPLSSILIGTHSITGVATTIQFILQHPLKPISRGFQGSFQFSDMLRAAGFHRNVDGGFPQVNAEIRPIVQHLDDVRAQLPD